MLAATVPRLPAFRIPSRSPGVRERADRV